MKNYSLREVEQILRGNGYRLARWSGSHAIYKNGNKTISIGTCNNNSAIFRRLIKENGLIIR